MIEVKDLYFSYTKGKSVLNGIDLQINSGEYVAILGENGSGKSTLARHFNGLLLPDKGYVKILGMDTQDALFAQDIRKLIGMVFQDPMTQFVGATVWEDVSFGPANLCWPRKKILESIEFSLENLGISDLKNAHPFELSGGQMQLAAIAGVLAMHPNCIIFDEANSMLDPLTKSKVLALLRNLHRVGKTVICVTHSLTEAIHADRVVLLKNGMVAYDGKPTHFLEQASMDALDFEIPPLLELSLLLKKEGILESVTFDMDKIVEEICRFR